MSFDAAAVSALFDGVVSHAASLGVFRTVNGHEPKSAPGKGLTCSIWLDAITPEPAGSGLAAVTGRVTFHIRVYNPFMQKPEDNIDPDILAAVATLLAEYSGHFTLGGTVRDIDLLGLNAQAGYLSQDGRQFRIMVITLPIVINDLWGEAA